MVGGAARHRGSCSPARARRTANQKNALHYSIVRQSKALVWVVVFPMTSKAELNLRLGLVCGNERVYFIDVIRQLSEARQ